MVDNPIRQDTVEQEPGAMANSGLDECHFRSTSSPCGHAIIGDPGRIHWRELPACCRAARPRSLNLDRRHTMSTAIAIEGVTKRFGSVVAVDRLDLKVPRGSLYGFIGPNGSGKSTTLRMIMHILLPDQGEVEVLGQRDTRAAQERVSYLPEERGLYKRMNVRRLLRYFGSLKGARQPELDQSIDKWLEKMGLSDWIDKKIDALSKGMAQKVLMRLTLRPAPPAWQVALSVVLTTLTAMAIVWAAGKIFRTGLLMQGKPPSFVELARWVMAK